MTSKLEGSFAAFLHRSALRRVVAMFCALALVMMSLADAVHHLTDANSQAPYQVSTSFTNGAPDSLPAAPAAAVNHCHGCLATGIMVVAQPAVSAIVLPDRFTPRVDGVRPHPPTTETPPPRLTI